MRLNQGFVLVVKSDNLHTELRSNLPLSKIISIYHCFVLKINEDKNVFLI